ncbi:MAG: hypothetical protein HOW73_24280 [Polyangiaceae bacterium]|nr:hypothetical protein [Polyangiaceae bacterium]
MSRRFIDAYLSYFDSALGPPGVGDDPDAEAWVASQRLQRSDEGGRWLRGLAASAPPDTQWQYVPRALYSAFTWHELDVPMMRLVGPKNRLLNGICPSALQHGSWPFALDLGDGGYYVADVAAEGRGAVWWCPNDSWDRAARNGPYATSMEHLLEVVALLLTPSGSLTNEQIRHEIQSIDPLVAGPLWDGWWARQLDPSAT